MTKTAPPTLAMRREWSTCVSDEKRRSNNTTRNGRPHHHNHGLSLVEMLLALAISAILLTATMVALDISFKAYADAAEQASTQAATRMVTNRLLALMRTSTEHGPLEPIVIPVNDPMNPTGVPLVATLNGNILTSNFIDVLDPNNNFIRMAYDDQQELLFLYLEQPAGNLPAQIEPLLGGVTNLQFSSARRLDNEGLWVLSRGTLDLTIQPDSDATLAIENGHTSPIRVIGSTNPRKID